MDPYKIIEKYYNKGSELYYILVTHSKMVADKAISIAINYLRKNKNASIDLDFVREAALLHDIGIFLTDSKKIFCEGAFPYISHGYLGSLILQEEGFLPHAMVAERHVGTGLSKEEVINEGLMLPKKDMLPETIEEKIICLADKFYSKRIGSLQKEETIENIEKEISRYGEKKIKRFEEMKKIFL